MKRKRELATSPRRSRSLGDRALASRADTPPARRHFTRLDQVAQLVGVSEADPELGYMARLLALCTLPRTNLRQSLAVRPTQWSVHTRHDLPRQAQRSCPSVHLPRLLLAWVTTEAVRTQSPRARAGVIHSPSSCGSSDIYSTGRAKHTSGSAIRWNDLFNASVSLTYAEERSRQTIHHVAHCRERHGLLVEPETRPDERSLWESKIELGAEVF